MGIGHAEARRVEWGDEDEEAEAEAEAEACQRNFSWEASFHPLAFDALTSDSDMP